MGIPVIPVIPKRMRVTVAADDGDDAFRRGFCLTRPVLWLLVVLLLVLFIIVGVLVVDALSLRDQRATIGNLERQLAEARTEVLTARILKAELEQARRMQQELLTMLGAPRADSSGAAAADTAAATAPPDGPPPEAAAAQPPKRWPASGLIIREFTRGDVSRGVEEHLGVDIAGEAGDRVVAVADGDVDFVGADDILGRYVEIRHGLEYVTIYGHCSWVGVGPGHRVRAGEQIAKMGHSGQTSIDQLHFEVWQQGVAVDPRKLLAGEPPPR